MRQHLANSIIVGTYTTCICLWLLLAISCGIIRPRQSLSNQPSFDIGGQTSGLLGRSASGDFIITERARIRFNALADRYGSNVLFQVPVTNDYGISTDGFTNGTQLYFMSKDAMVKFGQMTQLWRDRK